MACGSSLRLKDRYRAVQLLGQGGFGKTFKAIDEDRPGQPLCVIKQFAFSSDNPRHQQMALNLFYEEAKHLQSFGNHPQIPELLAYFDVEGQPYLVQEYIDGQDLEEELKTEGRFEQQKIQELLRSLLPVLDFLHHQSKPIIHRDIKPANIIRRRSDRALILVDFGAAKIATQTALARTGTVIGSPEFTAPEQARGKPLFASDIYSLGVTCIYLLTGVPPFDLFDTSQDDWVWRDYLVDNPVDKLLGEVLDKSIINAVAKRYQMATEVLLALNHHGKKIISFQPNATPTNKSKNFSSITALEPDKKGVQNLLLDPSITKRHIFSQHPNLSQEVFSFETIVLKKVSRQTIEVKKIIKPGWLGMSRKEVAEIQPTRVSEWQVQKIAGQASRCIEDLGHGVKLEMVAIPGGKFLMGAPNAERNSRTNEMPQHLVKVPRFYLGRYLITQEQYIVLMGNNPAQLKKRGLPVEMVTWHDAQAFCRKLTQLSHKHYRLPSEAEWEYACRARTTTSYCFGNTISPKLANYDDGRQGAVQNGTTPVKKFPPNGFGLSDMHGNVWEWCEDGWHDNYDNAPTDGSVWMSGESHVLRGGSWFVNASACRSAYRSRSNAVDSDAYIGFRVAYSPPDGDLFSQIEGEHTKPFYQLN
jgi:formylglycine-generating enzyme required for sulfatase activity